MSIEQQVKEAMHRRADLFVAPDGDDAAAGSGPLATLEGARDAVRALRRSGGGRQGVIVELAPGTYPRSAPLALTAADSGMPNAPVIYRARRGAEVRILGGRVVSGFEPVTDPAVLDRLSPEAHGNVLQADLRAQGIDDFGQITAPEWAQGRPGMEVFCRGERMTLARWPNDGFTRIVSIDVEGNTPLINRVTKSGKIRACQEGRFVYDGDRPARWSREPEGWLHGHWFWDWADQRLPIDTIDTEKRVISLGGSDPRHGFRAGQWFYALNLLCELDRPGEWYVDRDSGILYFWPPQPLADGDVSVSIAETLVEMADVSCVALQGLTLENARGTAVTMAGGAGNLVCASTIRNTGSGGIRIDGGTDHGVVGCDLYELGEGGIEMTGGDRVTLTPGRHYAVNNHVHHCSRWNPLYHPGIAVFGVGHRVAHNLLYELPHTAIGFTGNDQVLEFNEIHSAVYMANDAGAIYTSPPTEELTMYGHLIRHNYVHHIYGFRNRGCNGAVYLDDFFPGTVITGNIFYRVPRAAFIGGGRYCTIDNNIFVDCEPAIHVDARGLGWAAPFEAEILELLEPYPYRDELWSGRYPTLVDVRQDEPMVPKGNVISRNICWGGSWDEIEDKARPHVVLRDNLVDVDPRFADRGSGSFELADDSPAFELGFTPIPEARIGLYPDELRARWPVHHEPREGGLDVPEDKTW